MARVLIYKDFFKTGRGADRATAALANTMAQRGHEVHVLTQQSAKTPFSVTFDEGITCHAVPMRKRPFARVLNKLLLTSAFGEAVLQHLFPGMDLVKTYSFALQARVKAIAPEIVIAAGSNECVDLLLAGALPMPVIMMFHVYPPECFRKDKFRRASRLRRVLPLVAESQVLLPSHCEALRSYANVPVTAIGNGIAWPAEERLPPFETREKTLVYIAYFTKDKNHSDLLKAFALVEAPGWELHLYGSGTPEWEARLKTLAETLNLGDRVRFMGVTQAARPILLRAGICAYPSKVEGFGLALAEAMWCGLPCVGFADAPGVNELLVHEANGLLAEPTPEAFAAQLQRLIDSAQLREHLGEVAARTARRTWSQAANVQQWDDLLARHLREKPAQLSPDVAQNPVGTENEHPEKA